MINSTQIKPLKDLCENFKNDIVDGPFGSNMKRSDYVSEGVPVLKIQNIKPFSITLKKMDYVTKSKYEELKRHSYTNGDIVMTKLGDPLGASAIVEGINDGLIVADLVRVRAKKIDTKYLCYHLNSPITQENINSQQKGATRPRVKISSVRELPIFAPSSEEQKQIVAILDQAFAAIDQAQANIQQNIQNAQDLFQSKLNQIFSQQGEGWEVRPLNKLCDVKDGTHSSPKYVDEKSGIPFVTQKNILDSGISFENTKFISQIDHEDFYRRSNVSFGDILFSMIGANRGMACIVDDERIFSIKNVGLIKASDDYRAKYLLYFLKSPIAKKYVSENSSGSAQGFIGLTKLREFPVPFTDIYNQREIEQELDLLYDYSSKLEMKYSEKLNSLEELKKSLLQKAFNGELTRETPALLMNG